MVVGEVHFVGSVEKTLAFQSLVSLVITHQHSNRKLMFSYFEPPHIISHAPLSVAMPMCRVKQSLAILRTLLDFAFLDMPSYHIYELRI